MAFYQTDLSAFQNRGRNTQNALQNWITDAQQKEQQTSTDNSNVAMMIAKQYLQLPPDVQQKLYATLPADSKRLLLDPSSMPAHTPTPEEAFATDKANFGRKAIADPTLLGPGGAAGAYYHTLTGANPDTPVSAASVAKDVYANKATLPPEMLDRQQIADKMKLDAQQQTQANENTRDYSTIKLPESKQKISGERTTQAKVSAETGKVGEETRGLKQTNDMLSTITAPGAPAPSGDASNISPLARAIVERKADPKLLQGMARKPEGLAQLNAIEQQVKTLDPNFSMADYPAYASALKGFTGGKEAQNITAIKTAIRHLNSLDDDLKAMDNTSFPTYNAVANIAGNQLGNKKIQEHSASVQKDADAVANELNKAFRGSSQLSEKDTASWRQGLDENTTPAAQKGAIAAAVKLLSGRVTELQEQYKRAAGPYGNFDFIGTPVRRILKKLGVAETFGGDQSVTPTPNGGGNPDPLGILK